MTLTVTSFAEIESEFNAFVGAIAYATMVTVDAEHRPRTRVLIPVWEAVDGQPRGWLATYKTPVKTAHLAVNPHTSFASTPGASRRSAAWTCAAASGQRQRRDVGPTGRTALPATGRVRCPLAKARMGTRSPRFRTSSAQDLSRRRLPGNSWFMTQISAPSGVLPAVAQRWPTLLGLAFAALSLFDMENGRSLAFVVFLAALIYLGTAVLGKPGTVWALFIISTVAWVVLDRLEIDAWPGLVGGAISLIVIGLMGGLLRRPVLTAAQVPAMVVFGGAALLALTLSPQAGGFLVAAALIGHAVQDVLVWRAKQVVARSMAEFCMVLDLILGVGIVVLS
ncbi:hypothetical protein [Nonomuraea helvata]|uniref:Pyridoxamine 5'-phosphate oxidase putative domain-containing protein n=1 Tax=Nonomuraea helvata TaxID=37484 RepID=A0ABV5SH54_9ACTN